MALFTASELRVAETVGPLGCSNPFLPERIAWERAALGEDFDDRFADWNLQHEASRSPNVQRLQDRCEAHLAAAHERIERSGPPAGRELELYRDLLLFVLFHRYRDQMPGAPAAAAAVPDPRSVARTYDQMWQYSRGYLTFGDALALFTAELPHLFACFCQMRRAFDNIFQFIIGVSGPAVALRAAVWQSIFTHDLRRYGRVLFDRMGDFTTLVMGPSGTGKELVARAVGLSRYQPFDPRTKAFAGSGSEAFFPISLSAMSPTLIESELFGHKRGSFTGAVTDRAGWLEVCPAHGTVFLDEIGDLDPAIQVKLLRVLQARSFSRLGETDTRQFPGKIVAATNRNLADEMQTGRFRQDLYYRLCSDNIQVPSLRERIAADPSELRHLIAHVSQRLIGEEGSALAQEVEAWIERHLGPDYEWPGNVRELEQCIRNVLIRHDYVPPRRSTNGGDDVERVAAELQAGRLTATSC